MERKMVKKDIRLMWQATLFFGFKSLIVTLPIIK